LASIGLYGVLAYSATRRTSEIGLRMAWERTAEPSSRWSCASGALVGSASLLGLALPVFATRPLAMFLVSEPAPTDPVTWLGVIGVLAAVAAAATLAPALRAIRIDPLTALRSE
jgi:putative ABC transport system permease protein